VLISIVIAKTLAFVDAILENFVTVSATQITGACANLPIYNAEMTPCGNTIALYLAGLAEVGMNALNGILSGLLSV